MNTDFLQIHRSVLALLRSIAPEANLEALQETDDLRTKLSIDSFDFLNLMIEVSEQFDIEIPETDYGRLSTLDAIASYIFNATQKVS